MPATKKPTGALLGARFLIISVLGFGFWVLGVNTHIYGSKARPCLRQNEAAMFAA